MDGPLHAAAFQDSPDDTEEAQVNFVSALTASAFALAAIGTIVYAWVQL